MLFEKIKEVGVADAEMLRLEGSEGGLRVPRGRGGALWAVDLAQEQGQSTAFMGVNGSELVRQGNAV